MKPPLPHDLTRTTLLVLIVFVLIAACLWTLLPFLGALIWAATMVVATWPMLLRVQRMAGGRRWVATTVMTIVLLLVFVIPFAYAIGMLIDAATQGVELARTFFTKGLGPPPAWVAKVPFMGERILAAWQELAAGGPEEFARVARPYARSVAAWAVGVTGGVGMLAVHFLLIVIITAVLYARGELAAKGVLMFARRIGHERGEQSVRLAGMSVRGVALGVVVTAVIQSLLAWLGLWVAGVPHAGLLLALAFALCVAQLGPLLVLAPAVIWLYWSGNPAWGTALLVYSVPVIVLDNFLRPVLIRRGVELPLLLIIAGVIGGLVGFGVIGLFVGPVVLAVTYTLLEAWILDDPAVTTDAARIPLKQTL